MMETCYNCINVWQWSFGVTMWEIYSHSKVPYPGIPNYEVLEYIENGHRLSKPKLCPTEVSVTSAYNTYHTLLCNFILVWLSQICFCSEMLGVEC